MREIGSNADNCFIGEVKCAHLRGRGFCDFLRGNINTIKQCPDFFVTRTQLQGMDVKTNMSLLAPPKSQIVTDLQAHEINSHYDRSPKSGPEE